MSEGPLDAGRRGSVRRVVGGAFDATVGRVSHSVTEAAVDVTGATVEQVIEEIEPYLVEEAIPRIVDGVTPYLAQTVVPAILDDLTPRLVEDLLPRILNDLRPYLEAELVPAVVDGLVPHLNESVAPELIDALMPKIEQEIAPQLIESLMPMIEARVAPQLIESLMPMIEARVAPQLIDALMPRIEQEIAPQLVDALMPKIRSEVVPTIMDDIIDEPAVRDLIREQSQGLFLDAIEGFRGALADADTVVDRVGRHLLRRGPRPAQPTALALVLDQEADADTRPLRLAVADLAQTRAMWRELPVQPAPAGRSFTYGGAVTRLLALAIDVTVIGWVASQGLTTLINLLESFLGTLPGWFLAGASLLAASLIPIYLTLCCWAMGRTLGMAVTGLRVCTPDGRRPGFLRCVVRSWSLMLLLFIWLITGPVSVFDPKRRSLLDMLLHTEVRYSVPETQQRRHMRDALQKLREQAVRPDQPIHDGAPVQGPDGLPSGDA